MSECSVCNVSVQTRNKISCTDCKKPCHANCVNMTKADIDCLVSEKQIWRCPPCSKTRRKSMAAVTAAEGGIADTSQIIFMLDEAREDRKRMEHQFNASFEFAHGKIDDQKRLIEDQSKKLAEYLDLIEKLTQDNIDLKRKVKDMEVRLEDVEQYSRSNTVEIFGVPEEKGEDTYEVVKKICTALDMDVTRERIDVCHRLGRHRGGDRPAGIIARFVRREDKIELIRKRKVKRNFSTDHLGIQQAAVPVYINESLCQSKKKLYAAAREVKKDKNYSFLWVQNGNILMRKEQGASVVRISSADDLNNL